MLIRKKYRSKLYIGSTLRYMVWKNYILNSHQFWMGWVTILINEIKLFMYIQTQSNNERLSKVVGLRFRIFFGSTTSDLLLVLFEQIENPPTECHWSNSTSYYIMMNYNFPQTVCNLETLFRTKFSSCFSKINIGCFADRLKHIG